MKVHLGTNQGEHRMRGLGPSLAVMMFIVSGCLGAAEPDCGLSVKPQPLGEDETASPVADAFLSEHQALRQILEGPHLSGGAGSDVPCEEGARLMSDLRALGGTSRTYNEYAHETMIAYQNATYIVGMYPSVAN